MRWLCFLGFEKFEKRYWLTDDEDGHCGRCGEALSA